MSQNQIPYVVSLPPSHPGYQSVTMVCPSCYSNYVVVMVDVEKLIYYSDRDKPCYVVAPASEWSKDKLDGVREFLAPPGRNENYVDMPIVHFNEAVSKLQRPFWKFFGPKKWQVSRSISYTNGRHRTRYLHFAGAKKMPVYCRVEDSANIALYCV